MKICNMCGKEFDMCDYIGEYGFKRYVNFGSKYDGDYISIDLCCGCMDKFIESCKINPVFETFLNDEVFYDREPD